MKDLVVFITNHWVLVSILAAALLGLLITEIISGRTRSKDTLSVEEVVHFMNHQSAVVFDVRKEGAFLDGHIIGAESVSLVTLEKKITHLQKYLKKPVIIATEAGEAFETIKAALVQKGFSPVFTLKGGMHAWKAAGMPVVK